MQGGHWARAQTSGMRLRCGPCFSKEFTPGLAEDECCNSCSDLRSRNIPVSNKHEWIPEQCLSETGYWTNWPARENEGCRFDITASVAKLTGTSQLVFTLKEKLDLPILSNGMRNDFKRQFANFSHTITRLGFGDPYPGLVHVLDGRSKTQMHDTGASRFQYDLHLIPTKYRYLSGQEASSHQYSVTEFAKKITYAGEDEHNALTSGIYMNYDVTPFTVKVTEWKKSWTHFITECCAILGGIFAFSGMLDTFAYRITKNFSRRFTGESTVFDTPSSALHSY